jgi:hypothetical protein
MNEGLKPLSNSSSSLSSINEGVLLSVLVPYVSIDGWNFFSLKGPPFSLLLATES